MEEILGISEELFLDSDKIKIYDGIAGAGKSSIIDGYLTKNNIPYLRLVSTNQLKRDAEKRFNGKCETICSGLFENKKFFYDVEKYPDVKTLVIDECLQTNSKVLRWAYNNKGKYNIIITTDSAQMLGYDEQIMLKTFSELCSSPDVIVGKLYETKRAQTEATKKVYNDLYKAVFGGKNMYNQFKDELPTIKFEDIEYNTNDIFIVHTNNLEELVYNTYNLSGMYDEDILVPKGVISRKNAKDIKKYPILPQNKAYKSKGYFQLFNVATATRYQGQEVEPWQKLYFLVEEDSKVSNREFYTVCTRCKNIESLIIVICPKQGLCSLTEFNGVKIARDAKTLIIDKKNSDPEIYDSWKHYLDFRFSKKEGDEVEINGQKGVITYFYPYYSELPYLRIIDENGEPLKDWWWNIGDNIALGNYDDVTYQRAFMIFDGQIYNENGLVKKENKGRGQYTISGLISKEADLDYNQTEEIYKILDINGLNGIAYIHRRFKWSENNRELDLRFAYAQILKNCRIPVSGKLYRKYDETKMNFFVSYDENFTHNCIITDEMADLIEDKKYLFSMDYRIGSNIGEMLIAKSYLSLEDKSYLKTLKWGVLQQKYLSLYWPDSWEPDQNKYVLYPKNTHEILMAAICSILCRVLMDISLTLNCWNGYIKVDAYKYNQKSDIITSDEERLIEALKEKYPWLEYRIFKVDGEEKTILYQNYQDLKSKEEIRKEKLHQNYLARKAKKDECEKTETNG